MIDWGQEQLEAIERRTGDLLLDAGAGSGKTSVLVERFVGAVVHDGVEVGAILAITFTDKAAAELRHRIRFRLRELGRDEEARATEGAFISTIHGFCARVLRAHALAAGIDPAFDVLDEAEAARLRDAAFDGALEQLADEVPEVVGLIASYSFPALRWAIVGAYAELRARGQTKPSLPRPPAAPALEPAWLELEHAIDVAASELGAIPNPPARVVDALGRLGRVRSARSRGEPWPPDLDRLRLPAGNGAALSTPACASYSEALAVVRRACEVSRANQALALLDRVLRAYGARYEELKRLRSGVDFADLELVTSDLMAATPALRERYRSRFAQIMVDEMQDTNPVQLALIESIANENLFTVGDAMQSIYGFRHADVELFERRRQRLAELGAVSRLATNYRSRPELLDVINAAFSRELGERFVPLRAGRDVEPADGPRVELLIAGKGSDWADDGLVAPWRVAEARGLASRIRRLIDDGAAPGEIVVLSRATTDLRAYERALEDRGVPTYMIGGRGYWSHPQVSDVVAYLRALANPRDEEALYTVLASPLVGVSADALVLIASAGRAERRDPWWVLRSRLDSVDGPDAEDRERLEQFAAWFAQERPLGARVGVEELIERVVERTGYDLHVLALPGGSRRLANVRKLMRLAREHEVAHGRGLRSFVDLVRHGGPIETRESEAPVEGEALDAVRLMTIHRAKGLEFPIVCVADLGRGPHFGSEILRLGREGRIGLRLARPGTVQPTPALDYDELGKERLEAEAREERRIFYVAMTRARERLILSGAAKLDPWPSTGASCPMAWIGPALVPDIAARVAADPEAAQGVTDRVAYAVVRPEGDRAPAQGADVATRSADSPAPVVDPPAPLPPAEPPFAVPSLSYSSLGEYSRCGYRFYLERVLDLPAAAEEAGAQDGRLSGADRGVLVHALLERLDFRHPLRPSTEAIAAAARAVAVVPTEQEAGELAGLVESFGSTPICRRLAGASDVRREERFGFMLGAAAKTSIPVTGFLDVVARERDGGALVVDYKSDRLEGSDPASIVAGGYAAQRLIYALALLETGAAEVEVAYVFLEAPERPVAKRYDRASLEALRRELAALAAGVLNRRFEVAAAPHRALCHGCPGQDALCSWPRSVTRREDPDRLF